MRRSLRVFATLVGYLSSGLSLVTSGRSHLAPKPKRSVPLCWFVAILLASCWTWDCQGQALGNPSFETDDYVIGIFGEDGYWFGNTAEFVETSAGIDPLDGSRMINFASST